MSEKPERVDMRKLVYDAVRRYPGIHLRNLERQVGTSAALAQYHLKHLVDEGFVEVHDQGGYTRYYPTSKGKSARVTAKDVPILGLLREGPALHIVLVLLDHGPKTHGELARETKIGKSTLSYHLAKLAEVGIVERVPSQPALRLANRDYIYRLLLTYSPTPDLLDTLSDLWRDLYE
jgi:predicted transcriptional regulator